MTAIERGPWALSPAPAGMGPRLAIFVMAVIKNRQLLRDTQEAASGIARAPDAASVRLQGSKVTGINRILPGLTLSLGFLVAAAPAAAEWQIYGSGEFGFSVLEAKADGQAVTTTRVRPLDGNDDDLSPLVGGTLGIGLPMNEILPRRFTGHLPIPDWLIRLEVEGIALREYHLRTSSIAGSTGPIHTELDSWSVMGNLWLDVPLRGLYRPISWTSSHLFGRRRLQPVKDVLDRLTIDGGAGIGVVNFDAKVREADASGSDNSSNFAWQVGAGLGLRLSERIKMTVGYRYFDPGESKITLTGSGLQPGSELELDNEVHEARVGIRVLFYEFSNPWR
jgi:hypothetical protein